MSTYKEKITTNGHIQERGTQKDSPETVYEIRALLKDIRNLESLGKELLTPRIDRLIIERDSPCVSSFMRDESYDETFERG